MVLIARLIMRGISRLSLELQVWISSAALALAFAVLSLFSLACS